MKLKRKQKTWSIQMILSWTNMKGLITEHQNKRCQMKLKSIKASWKRIKNRLWWKMKCWAKSVLIVKQGLWEKTIINYWIWKWTNIKTLYILSWVKLKIKIGYLKTFFIKDKNQWVTSLVIDQVQDKWKQSNLVKVCHSINQSTLQAFHQ